MGDDLYQEIGWKNLQVYQKDLSDLQVGEILTDLSIPQH
jgi:hypothetical protein